MASEDYRIEYNGVDMGISKYIRIKKANTGQKKFNQLVKKYGLVEIENNNNIILFTYKEELYYYALVKHKIRKKGCKDWHTNVSEILK